MKHKKKEDRYSRQSFLGPNSEEIISKAVLGVAGTGGGGSHIVQQGAHIGFQNYVLCDPQTIEKSNLTRLVGSVERDVKKKLKKTTIAERVIRGLQPKAVINAVPKRWQEDPGPLRNCDIIFGCLDGFAERRELEALARRYLIPLIDIGMSVTTIGGQPPRMGGQIMLSMPGGPCMHCIGILTPAKLAEEAGQYGDAGINTQVVWANGILASSAIGMALDLLTDWTRSMREIVYLEYDGNKGTVSVPERMKYLKDLACQHYPATEVGDPDI